MLRNIIKVRLYSADIKLLFLLNVLKNIFNNLIANIDIPVFLSIHDNTEYKSEKDPPQSLFRILKIYTIVYTYEYNNIIKKKKRAHRCS